MEFTFQIPTRIIFGEGKAGQLDEHVKGDRALLLSNVALTRVGLVDRVKSALRGKVVEVFDGIEPNPSCETVDKAAEIAREFGAQCVIALGGGSVMDAAKAVSCLMGHEDEMAEYLAGNKTFTGRAAQLIVIPTTAGTGSEVTNVGVFNDTRKHMKKPLLSQWFWAETAIVDPAMTYSLPREITAVTGFDALCHAIEAYWSKSSQPFSDALAVYAVDLILKNLKKAYADGNDREARRNMSLGSLIAGAAFSQTRTTAVHAVSYPLSNDYGMDHGAACAITLVPFLRFCYPEVKEKMDRLASYAGFCKTDELIACIEELLAYTGLPTRLRQAGVGEGDLERIAGESMKANMIRLSPREITKEELVKLLRWIY